MRLCARRAVRPAVTTCVCVVCVGPCGCPLTSVVFPLLSLALGHNRSVVITLKPYTLHSWLSWGHIIRGARSSLSLCVRTFANEISLFITISLIVVCFSSPNSSGVDLLSLYLDSDTNATTVLETSTVANHSLSRAISVDCDPFGPGDSCAVFFSFFLSFFLVCVCVAIQNFNRIAFGTARDRFAYRNFRKTYRPK